MASVMFLQIISSLVMMMGFLMGPAQAFKYYVGGKDGWSLKPSQTLNHWASQNRFQVHDSLVFKYKNSVLQVNQDDYTTCNKTNPIQTLKNTGDSSTFNLDHSGLFFFISGHSDNCNKGQKILILVMAPRNASPTPAPSPTPFQGISSPVRSPTAPVPSPDASVPSEAASPFLEGPSQAPPPDDGKSACAPALGGDLVMLAVLVWMIFN